MSLLGFYGTYQVLTSSGTDFGLDTEVKIDDQAPDGTVPITFTHPSTEVSKTLHATYDDMTDSLRASLEAPNRVMVVSRFVDPTPGSLFRALYGIVIPAQTEEPVRHTPVWSAQLVQAETGADAPVATSLSPTEFAGRYTIRTTADAQFGTASQVVVTCQENGFLDLEIVNALGTSVLRAAAVYDPATVSLTGTFSGTISSPSGPQMVPATVVASLALDEQGKKYLYGNLVVGDPEQGGTYGGEEDDPGTTPDLTKT